MATTEKGRVAFQSARNQVQWIERYLYELNALLPQELPEHADTLGQPAMTAAPHFFRMLADLLLDQATLGVARLLDPSEQGPMKRPKVNLSMGTVINTCDWLENKKDENGEPKLATLICRLEKIKNTPEAQDVSQVRNTLLAHADYDTVVDYQKWAQRYREKWAKSGKTGTEVVSNVARNLADLLNDCRPDDEPPFMHPRYDKTWRGVAVVLQHLACGNLVNEGKSGTVADP